MTDAGSGTMRRDAGRLAGAVLASMVLAGAAPPAPTPAAPAPPGPAVPDGSLVRFRVGETVIQDWLRAVTPYKVRVGTEPLRTDLVFSDPQGLVLRDGRASFRIRVRGGALGIDQTLAPVVTVRHDPKVNRWSLVVSSLSLALPGLGTLDLKDVMPKLEIPALIDHLWDGADRAVGVHLDIRRITIVDRAVEVEAGATFRPEAPGTVAATEAGGARGR